MSKGFIPVKPGFSPVSVGFSGASKGFIPVSKGFTDESSGGGGASGITYSYGAAGNGFYFDIEVNSSPVMRSKWGDYTGGVWNPTVSMPNQMLDENDVATTDYIINGVTDEAGACGSTMVDPAAKSSTQLSIIVRRINNGANVAWKWNYDCLWSVG